MTETPISVLKEAAERGLRLEAQPDGLHVIPGEHCSPAFEETLRSHKPQLLALLRLPFVMVHSQTLNETIFFCEDEDTKASLIEAGAAPCCAYTRNELLALLKRHRQTPLSVDELLRIFNSGGIQHERKREVLVITV
jgi:hypothetical protein